MSYVSKTGLTKKKLETLLKQKEVAMITAQRQIAALKMTIKIMVEAEG